MPTEQRTDVNAEDYATHIAAERARIGRRRAFIRARPVGNEDPWALCLSGGGIRSATFCLGVLQALSEAPAPTSADNGPAPQDPDPSAPDVPSPEPSLLGQMDYLSTVSGGGYIGTFFASLFVPGRADKGASHAASAANAYETLRTEPGRLRAAAVRANGSARNAMCWLRENGRYMAPSSAGDLLYATTVVVRGWCGMHVVIGLALLLALALLNLLKIGLLHAAGHFGLITFGTSPFAPHQWWSQAWLSGMWMVPFALLALLAVPCACAYWLTYPPPGKDVRSKAPQSLMFWFSYVTGAAVVGMAAVFCAGFLQSRTPGAGEDRALAAAPFIIVVGEMVLGALWFLYFRRDRSFAKTRVWLTRQLTWVLKAIGVLAFLALADTLAQSYYLAVRSVTAPLTAVGVLTWLVRRMGPNVKGLQNAGRVRFPLEFLFAAAAFCLALLLVSVWDYGVIWLQWLGQTRIVAPTSDGGVFRLGLLLIAATALTLLVGCYPQFLNLSSLQNLYSARLTRAYQGASNGERFARGDKALSSAEALDSDHIDHATYNQNPYAPLHIINVCLNQNVDTAEQLVQRDRKGRPLAILPGTGHTGLPFAIDGTFYLQRGADHENTLTIGEWIGVSGAAAATGSGRQTSASLALLLGLSNVRLGRWWCSRIAATEPRKRSRSLRALLPTQAYLLDELGAHFYGTRRRMHYLSDGGHFENTGIYELLRQERKVKLVIACDCGADSRVQFDDLANLIRLARIDFQLEIEVDESVTKSLSQLRDVFGTSDELAKPTPGSNKCAMLLNVYHKDAGPERTPIMRIVLIKPVLIAGVSLDVHNYAIQNPTFPQQTTGDQFFDEAQWESYRKLGFEIGRRIFNSEHASHHQLLWKLLLQ